MRPSGVFLCMLPILLACGGGDADDPVPVPTAAIPASPSIAPPATPTERPQHTMMAAPARARDVGLQRTLGLSARQGLAPTVVEQRPGVVVAGTVGALLGAAIAWVVEPGLEFSALTGSGLPAALQVDWGALALLAGRLVATTLLTVILFSILARRVQLGQVLRAGDE